MSRMIWVAVDLGVASLRDASSSSCGGMRWAVQAVVGAGSGQVCMCWAVTMHVFCMCMFVHVSLGSWLMDSRCDPCSRVWELRASWQSSCSHGWWCVIGGAVAAGDRCWFVQQYMLYGCISLTPWHYVHCIQHSVCCAVDVVPIEVGDRFVQQQCSNSVQRQLFIQMLLLCECIAMLMQLLSDILCGPHCCAYMPSVCTMPVHMSCVFAHLC